MRRITAGLFLVVASLTTHARLFAADSLPDVVQFNRDIRPILSDACWRCHGPDQANRKGDLRLDTEAAALGTAEQPGVIVRGSPDKSELLRRLITTDADERMPPTDTGRVLTPAQIATIRRWIEQGAKWERHWAFLPPQKSPLPPIRNPQSTIRNPIDSFIALRLEQEAIVSAPEAKKQTLIRRATLDITGLPPTPEEVASFLADDRPDAYDRLIDRLLASPRYGERMAIRWLEAARYADTSGYQSDGPRYMWRWRDWVINAFNQNMPFDQFTVEQIAGDLLPNATLGQKIATGFNRNHRGNSEGGIIPEEYAVEYVVDRVDTTCTTWLGLTMGCVRCHDHKFDPFTQREYYGLFAYFNNVPEYGRAIKEGNSPPYIPAPTMLEQERLGTLQTAVQTAAKQVAENEPRLAIAQAAWEPTLQDATKNWEPHDGRVAQFSGLKNLPTEADVAAFGYMDKFSLALRCQADDSRGGTLISRMTDAPQADGYYVQLLDGRIHLNLVKRWLDDALRVMTERKLAPGKSHHICVTYDGSRLASGVQIYVDGQPEKLIVNLDLLNQTFGTKEPLRIGAGGGPDGLFRGSIDDVRVFERDLSADEASVLAERRSIRELLSIAKDKRTPAQRKKLQSYFLDEVAPDEFRNASRRLIAAQRELARFEESISSVMVMAELPQPRPAHLLQRGEYDKPGAVVPRGVPASLNPLPNGAVNNRLGLARWLVDRQNPLTARVMVNRVWQSLFGIGLVKTTEDFGSQGEVPPHQALLDWLAVDFQETGWDLKRLQRTLVGSAAYRRSSGIYDFKFMISNLAEPTDTSTQSQIKNQKSEIRNPFLLDPENRLLARGPRYRLPAEVIRDQALAAAGLLVERVGGPSVKPYQPVDFWKDLANDSQYVQSTGADLYRRSLYTFWRRTISPPTLTTFDATTRDTCTVKPTRTNTPLQALTLLNETTFVEASRVLAEQTLLHGGATADARIRFAFQRLVCREPSPTERTILSNSLAQYQRRFQTDEKAAQQLLAIGDLPRLPHLAASELAAYTAIVNVILNLDEVVTKE